MMAQDYYTILTNAGLAYEAACKANQVPIKLTHLAVGDGNGAAYNPGPDTTALRRETHRQAINSLLQDEANPSWLMAEALLADDVGGWTIREVGIYTDTGILYAIGKYPDSVKPVLTQGSGKQFYVRAIFQTSNATSVTLLIDNSIVMATRAFVLDHVKAELAKLDAKNSVKVATTANLGALSGLLTIDGVALAAGDRALVKDQVDAKTNGIYVVAAGAWSRAQDADASIEVTPGLLVTVEQGAANGDSLWQLVTDGPISLGTTPLTFEIASGPTGLAAGTYRSVTIDKRGRVVGGGNPTTLAGYGITDAQPYSGVLASLVSNNAFGIGYQVVDTKTDINAYLTGGKFITPSLGVTNLPEGWVQGRHLLDVTGGVSYAMQMIASANYRRVAVRTAVGVDAFSPWMELLHSLNHVEASEPEALAGTSGSVWMSPRRVLTLISSKLAQATEAALGVAKVASQALVNTGDDDATIVTPKKLRWGFQASITANGYIVFPTWLGSLILQWGLAPAGSSVNVSYPLAFPNELFAVVFGDLNDNPGTGETVAVNAPSGGNGTTPTTTSMGLTKYSDSAASSHRVYWIAVGR
jgi:hypothetical protein